MVRKRRGFLHQQRRVRPDARSITSAKQTTDRLSGRLAEQIPQRDIDAADRVRDRSAASLPERILMQLLADPLRLESIFVMVQWFKQLQCPADQRVVGKHAARSEEHTSELQSQSK